ncbi:CDP-glycerol glycerophosphotransferase family protein [Edaphobacillus lindanitolerans]|uniref:CDP-ribitol ribitolphosphotransferase n=1 Tax=Edaphobacillus lindanitolerans TaxID=550447 RepID=A0A1U7PMS1_9BACI|nr:CDP-glycerol glycerophosphotransferase family protein [Edaphobacillus lindanitolerans]SIT70999.1 CDP-ribitol ribitolphosphotransferase [Edaphobacillus lindanitolerans]
MSVVQSAKYTLLRLFRLVFNGYYQFLRVLKPIDPDKVVIVQSRSRQLEGNLKYVHNELLKQRPAAKIHLISPVNRMNLMLFKELKTIVGAKYVILEDYYLPVYLIKPDKQMKIIQLWHAAGAFKKVGYSTVNTKFGPAESYLKVIPVHSNYTHVYVSSGNIVPNYAEAFNMPPERIHPLGIPRTDFFFEEQAHEKVIKSIKEDHPIITSDRVIILFAPTYRAADSQKESSVDFIETLKALSNAIRDDQLIVYRPHPYLVNESMSSLGDLTNVLVAADRSINEWMLVADAFITDYSSAIFEYALLERPLAHYVPDLGEYENSRGLYYPIGTISDGALLKNIDELVNWTRNRQKNEKWDTSRMIAFTFSNKKNTSQKIVEHFLGRVGGQ